MKALKNSLLCVFIFCTSCVTSYKGPLPNLNAQGEEGVAEIKKFTLSGGTGVFQFNDRKEDSNWYWKSSVMPVVESVSPEAYKKMKRVDYITYASSFFLVAALAVLIGDSQDDNFEVAEAYYGLLGLSLGATIYSSYENSRAVEQYNRDLRGKLSPKVTLLKMGF